VAKVLDKLPKGLQREVIEAIAMPSDDLPASAIADELNARGYKIGYQSVQRHRRGKCQCPDELRGLG
jgi:repressor of nif and glnA expression